MGRRTRFGLENCGHSEVHNFNFAHRAGLNSLFDIHGTPNVLRVVSGSCNVTASLNDFVDEHHVVLLPSPAGDVPSTLGAVQGRNDTTRQLAQINFGAGGHGAADAPTDQTTLLNKGPDVYNATRIYTAVTTFHFLRLRSVSCCP